jgi:quercetin dioxygenase-like cupin family protein
MPKFLNHPEKELVPGIHGSYIHGANASLGYVTIKAGSVMPMHHHPHEQLTLILDGELEMEIGGKKVLLTKGMSYVIPSNTPHAAKAHADCTVIDVFSPVREEYRY